MSGTIAILGWGSLLWDPREEFDSQHHEWIHDGPTLKLEFSRISKTRKGALTLVLDSLHGSPCKVAYALSNRSDPEDAIWDLRCRESTTRTNIGYAWLDGSKSQSHNSTSLSVVRSWAEVKGFTVVVWTDLQSNFEQELKEHFRIEAAISYVHALPVEGRAKAAEYVWRTPPFVDTFVRRALEAQSWFRREGG